MAIGKLHFDELYGSNRALAFDTLVRNTVKTDRSDKNMLDALWTHQRDETQRVNHEVAGHF
jgi:hypothetical protein